MMKNGKKEWSRSAFGKQLVDEFMKFGEVRFSYKALDDLPSLVRE